MVVGVWVFELDGAFKTYEFLCKLCAIAMRAVRNQFGHVVWTKVAPVIQWTPWAPGQERMVAVNHSCTSCERARQAAPDYVTPTVDAVATGGMR